MITWGVPSMGVFPKRLVLVNGKIPPFEMDDDWGYPHDYGNTHIGLPEVKFANLRNVINSDRPTLLCIGSSTPPFLSRKSLDKRVWFLVGFSTSHPEVFKPHLETLVECWIYSSLANMEERLLLWFQVLFVGSIPYQTCSLMGLVWLMKQLIIDYCSFLFISFRIVVPPKR